MGDINYRINKLVREGPVNTILYSLLYQVQNMTLIKSKTLTKSK